MKKFFYPKDAPGASKFARRMRYMPVRTTFLILWAATAFPAWGQASFQRVYHDVGNVGLAVTNVGTLGKPDVRLRPDDGVSMRYPINSGIEHLFEGGLWIGARMGGQVRVSTAAVDAAGGYNTGAAGFEFTPLGSIQQRSTLPESPFFSSLARSHQDFTVRFTDSNQIIPGTSIKIPDHDLPLKAVVQLRTMAWKFSFAEYFVILEYTVTNASSEVWDSVYVGLYTDLVVRNVLVTRDAGTAFFNKGGAGWLDSLAAIYVYQVAGDDIDFTQTYAASQALGVAWRGHFLHPLNRTLPDSLAGVAVYPNFWTFRNSSGGDFSFPATDVEKYYRLSHGMDVAEGSPLADILKQPGNRIQLVSIGPIPQVAPGESFTYTHALVCAPQLPDPDHPGVADSKARRRKLEEHLGWALRSFLGEDQNANGRLDAGEDLNQNGDLDHFILPEPPTSPHVRVETGPASIDIYWDDVSLRSVDPISLRQDFEGFRLYRSNAGEDLEGTPTLHLIAQWDKPGNAVGYNNGFEIIRLDTPMTFPGDSHTYRFRYRLSGVLDGWQYVMALTAFDEGDTVLNVPPLESSFKDNSFSVFPGPGGMQGTVGVFPNPYVLQARWDGPTSRLRKIYFYNLPPACTITIYTLDGEVVTRLEHLPGTGGQDIQWFQNFAARENIVIGGGIHAWDLLSEHGQMISSGLYLFSVTDRATGHTQTGKFAVVK